MQPVLEPAREMGRLLVEPEALEGEGREGGVAQPRVAVVPVAGAAEGLGQAAGGRRDHGAGGLVRAELEREGRPLDHLAPAPPVVAAPDPPAPEFAGRGDRALHRLVRPALAAGRRLPHEPRALARAQPEPALGGRSLHPQGLARPQLGGGSRVGREARHVVPGQVHPVAGPGVVERGAARHAELHLAAHDVHPAHERAGLEPHRHRVGQLADPLAAVEAGDEHRGVGQVHLLAGDRGGGGDAERAAFVGVEDAGEGAGGVESAGAEPVDRPVHPHQRRRAQIADQPVALDGPVPRLVRAAPAPLGGDHRPGLRGGGRGRVRGGHGGTVPAAPTDGGARYARRVNRGARP